MERATGPHGEQGELGRHSVSISRRASRREGVTCSAGHHHRPDRMHDVISQPPARDFFASARPRWQAGRRHQGPVRRMLALVLPHRSGLASAGLRDA